MAWENTIHYLQVPYVEKDEVKALGAKWDARQKQWYYKGTADSRFDKWTPTPVMQLSDLSEEQQSMIALAKSGKNVLVDACIGSGKTTTIQVLCNEIPDKKVLYLTYNTLLKIDARDKIRGKNVTVTNYHGFAYMCLKNAHLSAGISDLIQIFLKNKTKIKVPKFDLLVIDEYQDIEQEIAEMLECVKKSNPAVQIVAVGDMKQKIYDKTTLNVPIFINQFLGKYDTVTFTKCFRLCSDLASRLGDIWGKQINGVNKDCKLETMELCDVIEYLAKQKPSDILCLGARTGKMASVLNDLEDKYPEKFNKKTVYASISDDNAGRTIPDKSTAIFTTFDSSKGLERKICVVFDYTLDYWSVRMGYPDVKYEILRNIFCVAMSRGKEKIIIVKEPFSDVLPDEIVATPVPTNGEYKRPFQVSEMFDFKYKEDVEECYQLIRKRKKARTDKSIIDVDSEDFMIDLSPCIGIYQEASFFENYDIDAQIRYAMDIADDRPPLNLKENATMEEKVLYLTAYETYQNRYYYQVKPPFLTEGQLSLIHNRLRTEFTGKEEVQEDFSMQFIDGNENVYDITGRPDVIKDNTVYELKFVEELSHEHFLQCACYMVAFGLNKGIVWNIRTNEQYSIVIPDRRKFMRAVAKAITKGRVKDAYFESDYLEAM